MTTAMLEMTAAFLRTLVLGMTDAMFRLMGLGD